MLKEEEASEREFYEALLCVNRVWDGQEGVSLERAGYLNILDDVEYILIRDDGWAIACSEDDLESCIELWEGQWSHKYTVNKSD